MNSPVYQLQNVSKVYTGPAERLTVLDGVDFAIPQGDSLAVLGASGSGKSTFLHLLGTLDSPSSGSILFHGRDLGSFTGREKATLRNTQLGFVFQFHHLLPEFTTGENVAMPARIAGKPRAEAEDLADAALGQVGLAHKNRQAVNTLSGGERQRAAIARAVVLNPAVILADEPTGNLDERTGERVGDLLVRLNREMGTTMVVVTHNLRLASFFSRQYTLHEGQLAPTAP